MTALPGDVALMAAPRPRQRRSRTPAAGQRYRGSDGRTRDRLNAGVASAITHLSLRQEQTETPTASTSPRARSRIATPTATRRRRWVASAGGQHARERGGRGPRPTAGRGQTDAGGRSVPAMAAPSVAAEVKMRPGIPGPCRCRGARCRSGRRTRSARDRAACVSTWRSTPVRGRRGRLGRSQSPGSRCTARRACPLVCTARPQFRRVKVALTKGRLVPRRLALAHARAMPERSSHSGGSGEDLSGDAPYPRGRPRACSLCRLVVAPGSRPESRCCFLVGRPIIRQHQATWSLSREGAETRQSRWS